MKSKARSAMVHVKCFEKRPCDKTNKNPSWHLAKISEKLWKTCHPSAKVCKRGASWARNYFNLSFGLEFATDASPPSAGGGGGESSETPQKLSWKKDHKQWTHRKKRGRNMLDSAKGNCRKLFLALTFPRWMWVIHFHPCSVKSCNNWHGAEQPYVIILLTTPVLL